MTAICPAGYDFCALSGSCLCSDFDPLAAAKKRFVLQSDAGTCDCSNAPASSAGLGTGGTIGIAVGASIIGLCLVVLIVWLALRRRRRGATVIAPSGGVEMTTPPAGVYGKIELSARDNEVPSARSQYTAAPLQPALVAHSYDRVDPNQGDYMLAPVPSNGGTLDSMLPPAPV